MIVPVGRSSLRSESKSIRSTIAHTHTRWIGQWLIKCTFECGDAQMKHSDTKRESRERRISANPPSCKNRGISFHSHSVSLSLFIHSTLALACRGAAKANNERCRRKVSYFHICLHSISSARAGNRFIDDECAIVLKVIRNVDATHCNLCPCAKS